MRTKTKRIGRDLVVVIPREAAAVLELRAGSAVEIETRRNELALLRPADEEDGITVALKNARRFPSREEAEGAVDASIRAVRSARPTKRPRKRP